MTKKTALVSELAVGPIQANCYIVTCPVTGDTAVIDAGDEAERIAAELRKIREKVPNLKLRYLLHTHGHFDHIGGTSRLKELFAESHPVIALHPNDEALYWELEETAAYFGVACRPPVQPDLKLAHEAVFDLGTLRLEVIHTPGHTQGCVCFLLLTGEKHDRAEKLFSGDTLFYRNIGRTDLPGGDEKMLVDSIRSRLFCLPQELVVCPGHGQKTTIAAEVSQNPYVNSV